MILIDAIYINHSGGKRLLEYFISYIHKQSSLKEYFFLLDGRLKSDTVKLIPDGQLRILDPKESERRRFYKSMPAGISSIFCFASVPPSIKIRNSRVVILQHNPFFFENPGFSLYAKFLYLIKKFYIRSRCAPDYYWIVQTPRIKNILASSMGVAEEKVVIKPFFELDQYQAKPDRSTDNVLSFIYAADGVPQKNHAYLFKVWENLHNRFNLLPELHLTIPLHCEKYIREIERLKNDGLKIYNHGFVSKETLKELYAKNQFLLFPSLSESFGLPLAEAANAGLKVIGSDLPFIYQVIEPSAVFDPHDVDSLSQIIVSMSNGLKIKETKVVVRDHIDEVIDFIKK